MITSMQDKKHSQRIACILKEHLYAKRVPQAQVGGVLGISQAAVYRRLSAQTEFSITEFIAVCGLAGVSPLRVMKEAGAR